MLKKEQVWQASSWRVLDAASGVHQRRPRHRVACDIPRTTITLPTLHMAACAAGLRSWLPPAPLQAAGEPRPTRAAACRPSPAVRRLPPPRRCRRAAAEPPAAGGGGGDAEAEARIERSMRQWELLEKLAALGDLNRLQTVLNTAIAAEDWELAAKLRDLLRLLTGAEEGGAAKRPADWRALGVLGWLAERAESLGFMFPTGKPGAVNSGTQRAPGGRQPIAAGCGGVEAPHRSASLLPSSCFLDAACRGAEAQRPGDPGRRRLHRAERDGQRQDALLPAARAVPAVLPAGDVPR